ncbi:MAG: cobalamin-dependent protein, partial [Planctomycetota bacterium]|nr:cobalamin-dependent protein [Planctomycetota bacterium]
MLRRRPRIAWLDLGDPGAFSSPAGPLERWQDHGLGLLRTVLRDGGVRTGIESVRSIPPGRRLTRRLARYDLVLMNVRSYTFPIAAEVARAYRARRRDGRVLVGGMHATVAPEEMEAEAAFDHIVEGAAEANILEIVQHLDDLPRRIEGRGAKSMAHWPMIDRTLWPDPRRRSFPWPLEPSAGWGPAPVATVLTSRSCPWRCAFCNESAYVPTLQRRPVDLVIDELNHLDETHGPLGSVVIHDSMFFQHPGWLKEWLDKYP